MMVYILEKNYFIVLKTSQTTLTENINIVFKMIEITNTTKLNKIFLEYV